LQSEPESGRKIDVTDRNQFYTSENVFLSSLIVHIPHRRRQIVDVSDPFNIDCR